MKQIKTLDKIQLSSKELLEKTQEEWNNMMDRAQNENQNSDEEESDATVYENPYGQEDDAEPQKSSIMNSLAGDDSQNLLDNYFRKKQAALI